MINKIKQYFSLRNLLIETKNMINEDFLNKTYNKLINKLKYLCFKVDDCVIENAIIQNIDQNPIILFKKLFWNK